MKVEELDVNGMDSREIPRTSATTAIALPASGSGPYRFKQTSIGALNLSPAATAALAWISLWTFDVQQPAHF